MCKDCKYWEIEDYRKIFNDPDYGECELIGDSLFNEKALAKTECGYMLLTKAEFHCNLFEEKNDKKD